MSEFVQLGEIDGVSVSYTTAAPRPNLEREPEPEIPPHVMANFLLSMELEAAYFNEPRKFRRARGNSPIARKKFFDYFNKPAAQIRREYFEELKEAVDVIESMPPPKQPTENQFPWWRDVGCSIVSPRQKNKRTVLVDD
jgi:hypothetical protein